MLLIKVESFISNSKKEKIMTEHQVTTAINIVPIAALVILTILLVYAILHPIISKLKSKKTHF